MKKNKLMLFVLCSAFIFSQENVGSKNKISTKTLLKTEASWDNAIYKKYPQGTPELTVLKIVILPHTVLDWHKHSIPNAAYVEQGIITVEKYNNQRITVQQGEVLAEVVDRVHRGYTGKEGATLIVFYAGNKNIPLTIPAR